MQQKELVKGNEAIAMGAISAGCQCFFAYPITPQSDIPEYMSWALVERGGEFIQAESEIAAANMLIGAAACGKRCMTSSSSPGISLKQEAISYMAGSELPAVIVNICRGGPGLGSIDPSQGDYFQATKGGGHGDYRTLVLAPASCQEAYELTMTAFDLAFKYRNPVLLLGDAILGQMKEPITEQQGSAPTNDLAEKWALSGAVDRPARIIKSLYLKPGSLAEHNHKLHKKYARMKVEQRYAGYNLDAAELIVVAYGSVARVAQGAVQKLKAQGYPVGLFRPITLYPFPAEPLQELAHQGKKFVCIENNSGQMIEDLRLAVDKYSTAASYCTYTGELPNPGTYEAYILQSLG